MVYFIIACVVIAVVLYFAMFHSKGIKKENAGKSDKKGENVQPAEENAANIIKVASGDADAADEKFRMLNYKKCRHCGGDVPKDDNICPNCNQIP